MLPCTEMFTNLVDFSETKDISGISTILKSSQVLVSLIQVALGTKQITSWDLWHLLRC